MKTKSKLSIDVLLFSFLCILVAALLDHTIKCINFFLLKNVLSEIMCFTIAFLFFALILLCIYKFGVIKLYKQRFDKFDIICLGIFLFYYLMKLPFPDVMIDVTGGEIFGGKFAFMYDVSKMKPYLPMGTGGFSLNNRVFYYFNFLFGYRLSTIVNFFIICISYYKVKEIITYLFEYIDEEMYKTINRYFFTLIICCTAFAALFKEYIILGSTVHKADLFVIPLFLEIILLLFTEKKANKTYAYAGLLIGLSVTLKLTNAALFIPFVVYVMVKEFSYIKKENILFALCFCFLPLLPYVICNTIITGNPVFPYYNEIFKSPYWEIWNFKDTRWGPKTTMETIFYPIFLLFNSGRFGELGFNSNSLAIGYLIIFFVIVLQKKIPELKKLVLICTCFFFSILLWSATTGYHRYMMPLEVLSVILLAVFIYTVFCNYFKRAEYLIFGCCLSLLLSLGNTANNLTLSNNEWSWRPSFFTHEAQYKLQAKPNIKYILNDKTATYNPIIRHKLDSVKTWVCINGNTIYPTLSNPSADFFWLDRNYPANDTERSNFTKNYFENRPKDGIYILTSNLLSENSIYFLNTFGFIVVDYENFYLNFVDANRTAVLISLMLKEEADEKGIKEFSFMDNI